MKLLRIKKLNTSTQNIDGEIILEAHVNIWRQFYKEKILKFIEDRSYSSSFSRKILHDSYKTLNLLYENMGHELIKNKMISYYEPTKKRICLLYTSPSPRDATLSRMPSSA